MKKFLKKICECYYWIQCSIITWIFSGLWLTERAEKHLIIPFILLSLVGFLKYPIKDLFIRFQGSLFLKLYFVSMILITIIDVFHGGFSNSIVRVIYMLFPFFIFYQRISKNHFLIMMLFGVLINSIYLYYTFINTGSRPTTIINPNMYASYFGMLCVVSFSLIGKFENKKAILITIFSLSFIGVFLLQSRAIIIAVLISIFIRVIFMGNNKNRWKISVLLFVLSLSSYFVFQNHVDRLYKKTIHQTELIVNGDLTGADGLRIQMYLGALHLMIEKPIIGWGNKYKEGLYKKYQEGKVSKQLVDFNVGSFHNVILDIGAKVGLLGLFLLLGSSFYIIKYFNTESPYKEEINMLFIFVGIISMVDHAMVYGGMFMLFAVLVFYLYQLTKEGKSGNTVLGG